VLSLVPSFGAFAQSFIVVIAGFLNQSLQTDEPAYFVSVLIEAEKSE